MSYFLFFFVVKTLFLVKESQVSFGDIVKKLQVPDYLCCKITLDIFRDPVITPCGVTYERSVILNHLEKVMFGLYIAFIDTNVFYAYSHNDL